jgi:hypothetical protein
MIGANTTPYGTMFFSIKHWYVNDPKLKFGMEKRSNYLTVSIVHAFFPFNTDDISNPMQFISLFI